MWFHPSVAAVLSSRFIKNTTHLSDSSRLSTYLGTTNVLKEIEN